LGDSGTIDLYGDGGATPAPTAPGKTVDLFTPAPKPTPKPVKPVTPVPVKPVDTYKGLVDPVTGKNWAKIATDKYKLRDRSPFQDMIDILGIPVSIGAGAIAAATNPKTSEKVLTDVAKGKTNLFDIGMKNALAPFEGRKQVQYPEVVQNVTGLKADNPAVVIGGLAASIAFDPLSYVSIGAPVKTVNAFIKGTAKGAVAAAKGIVPKVVTSGRAGEEAVVHGLDTSPTYIKYSSGSEAAQRIVDEASAKAQKHALNMVQLTTKRNPVQAGVDMAMSAVVAGVKNATQTANKLSTIKELEQLGRGEAAAARKAARSAKKGITETVYENVPAVALEHAATDTIPAVKTEPLKPIDTEAKIESVSQELIAPHSIEIAKQMRDAADAIAKKTRATLPDAAHVGGKVMDILNGVKAAARPIEAVSPAMLKSIKLALKDPESFSLQSIISNTAASSVTELAKISKKTFIAADGREIPLGSVFQAIRDGKRTFASLPTEDQTAIRNAMAESITAPVKSTEQMVVKQISDLIGEKAAREIVSTGATAAGLTGENTAKVYDILKAIPTQKTRSYKSAMDLIDGIQAGDKIAPTTLFNLLKALDPQNKIIEAGVKAATTEDGIKAIKGLLVTKGRNTIKNTETRLNLLSPEHLLNENNLPFSTAAQVAADRAMQGIATTEPAILRESRQEASRQMEKLETGDTGKMVKEVLDSVGRGMQTQFMKIINMMEDPATLIHENIAGRLAVSKVVDGKVVESVLPEPFSQYVETKVWASIIAKQSKAIDFARRNAAKKKTAYTPSVSRFTRVSESYDVLRTATLATFGTRLVNIRSVKEAGKEENLYNVYTDFGDFADVVIAAEKAGTAGDKEAARLAQSANEAFFPTDSGVRSGSTSRYEFRASNSFSPQGVGRAVNKLLESMDKKIQYPREEMIKDILSRASGDPKKWSKSFAAQAERRAGDIADLMISSAEHFAIRHTNRMLAEIEDMARPAQIMAADLFMPILDAARVYAKSGSYTLEQRAQLVSDALHKFAIGSDLFSQQNGYIALTAFRSAARIFITVGGLEDAIKLTNTAIEDMPLAARFLRAVSLMRREGELAPEFQKFIDGINTYSISVNKSAELITKFSKEQRDKLATSLTEAEMAYETLAQKLMNPEGIDNLTQVEADFNKAQRALTKARNAALGAKLPTRHWSYQKAASGAPDGWVSSRDYNRAAEIDMLNKAGVNLPVDLAEKVLLKEKLTAAEVKRIDKIRAEQNLERMKDVIAIHADDLEQVAADIEKQIPDEIEQGLYLAEEQATAVARGAKIVMDEPYQFVKEYIYSTTYKDLRETGKELGNQEEFTWASRFSEHFHGFGNKAVTRALFNAIESKTMTAVADTHAFFTSARRTFLRKGTTGDQFLAAFSSAVRGANVPTGNRLIDSLATDLHQVMSAAVAQLKAMNVDMAVFQKSLYRHGLSDANGFSRIEDLSDPENIWEIFETLPFINKPEFDLTEVSGKLANSKWEERNTAWKSYLSKANQGEADTAFAVMAKLIDSIQFAVMQQTLTHELVARFNYQAEGKTLAQAMKENYVEIKGVGGGFSVFDPEKLTAESGNLFHPEVARSIAWMNRELNRTFNGKALPNAVLAVQKITQVFKTFQTILRPGHWFTNLGDVVGAAMAGVVNPKHWLMGTDLAIDFAKETMKADYHILGGMKNALGRALGSLDANAGRAFDTVEKAGERHYQFPIGEKMMKVPAGKVVKAFKDRGFLTGDIHVSDSAMLYQEIASHAGGDSAGNQVIFKKFKDGFSKNRLELYWQKAIKPAGDFVAYTSNISRASHALKVMQERNYPSLEAALDAAADRLMMYHPTIQSTTATERKTLRMAASYYTWFRTAHVALFDMLMNHTGAALIPNKIFYSMAEANGLNPQSTGNLWGDKKKTPSYMDNSVYGPTMTSTRGPLLWRPPVPTMDVMASWNLNFDPAKSADANVWQEINNIATNLVGQSNMVLQPVGQLFTKTNPSTGAPEEITSTGQFVDKYAGMIPFWRVAQSSGLVTNPLVDPKTGRSKVTSRDNELTNLNFFFGQRLADVNKPNILQLAHKENRQKSKDIAKMISDNLKKGK